MDCSWVLLTTRTNIIFVLVDYLDEFIPVIKFI